MARATDPAHGAADGAESESCLPAAVLSHVRGNAEAAQRQEPAQEIPRSIETPRGGQTGFEYLIPGTSEEQHRLLDIFFCLKSARFANLGLPDVFADRETQAFLHGLLDKLDDSKQYFGLQMHVLRLKDGHEGKIAAISGISRKGDHIICQFGAIDEELVPDTSPGEFLYWQTISGLHGKGVALFDFGLGDQTYKRSWAPVETPHYDVVLPVSPFGVIA